MYQFDITEKNVHNFQNLQIEKKKEEKKERY